MMKTAFDKVIDAIRQQGYHNHRRQEHSDLLGEAIWEDLLARSPAVRADFEAGVIQRWLNRGAPGGRERRLDLFVGEPDPRTGEPDITRLRIGIEHKSVITAHRNRTSRYDDLHETLGAIHAVRQEAIVVATVLVGVAERVLNVPDRVAAMAQDFEHAILPRLSSGDETLWTHFHYAVSENRPNDPERTLSQFRKLPTRRAAHTHVEGFDYIALIPVFVDNVHPPRIERTNSLGIDVDREYSAMLDAIATAYAARWHT